MIVKCHECGQQFDDRVYAWGTGDVCPACNEGDKPLRRYLRRLTDRELDRVAGRRSTDRLAEPGD